MEPFRIEFNLLQMFSSKWSIRSEFTFIDNVVEPTWMILIMNCNGKIIEEVIEEHRFEGMIKEHYDKFAQYASKEIIARKMAEYPEAKNQQINGELL